MSCCKSRPYPGTDGYNLKVSCENWRNEMQINDCKNNAFNLIAKIFKWIFKLKYYI